MNYLRISYRIHFEVMWCALSEEIQAKRLVLLLSMHMICDMPFCRFLPWFLGDHGNLCWDETSHPWAWSRGEQTPAELWECTTNMKQLPDLSVISLTYKTTIMQTELNSTEQACYLRPAKTQNKFIQCLCLQWASCSRGYKDDRLLILQEVTHSIWHEKKLD